jgi:hypothetical protein
LIKAKQTGSEDTRYRSWEWCYQAFIDKRSEYENASDEKKKEIVDYLALHLGFYLASWGMYRGSSFLLQRDYKAHIKVVEILLEDQYKSLWGYTPAESTKGVPGLPNDLIFGSGELYDRIKTAYPNYYKANNDDASDTLITKILMGTMGCVPAFDRFFKRGIKWYQSKGFPFSDELCMTIENKGNKAGKTYGALEKIAATYLGALSLSGASVTYPVMKCLDMFLWQVGFELDLLDNLRQGKNEAKSIETANKLGITNSAIPSVVMNDIDNRWK